MEKTLKKRIVYFVSNEIQLQWINKDIVLGADNYIIILEKDIAKTKRNIDSDAKILNYTNYISERNIWIDALKIANAYFFDLNHIQVDNRYMFKDILGYSNHSLLEIDSISYFSGHTERLAKVFFKVLTINAIFDQTKPEQIVLMNPTSDWERIISNIAVNRGIQIDDRRPLKDAVLRRYFEYSFELNFSLGSEKKKILIPLPLLGVGVLLKNIRSFIFKKHLRSEIKDYNILLYCINSKYLDVVVPLIKLIGQDRESNPLLLLPQSFDGISKLQNESINFQYVRDYANLSIYKDALIAYVRVLIRYIKLRFNKTIDSQLFQYDGINLSAILSKEIKKSIYLSFSSILNILLIKSVITKHNSKILFMPHFSEADVKSFVSGAHDMGIPAICMHRGAVGLTSEYGTSNGDKVLVPGFYAQKTFEQWGVPHEKVIPTGTPIFDELIKSLDNANYIQKQVREILKINSDVTIITYLTQSFGSRFDENNRAEEIRHIFSALKNIHDVYLIIKLHPTEGSTEIYDAIAKEMDLKAYTVIKNEIRLDNLLLASKIAMTKNSTTGFNALLAGCQLIILGFNQNALLDNPFVDPKISDVVNNSEDLINVVKIILESEPNVRSREDILQFIKYHFNSLDLQATQRIKDVIHEAIRS
jgi:hypothetical protein